ncbi:MAG: hypothetical protein KatS3mg108_3178 [Isosphaeraceae bacterium]|nr:MAG: hypothetical protein KatS3mg108_3178 [Isosphaeraceae bacterium]
MSTGEPPPTGPQKPKPRPYTPPPGAAKPTNPPPQSGPGASGRPSYQPPPGAAKPPTPNRPPGAAAATGQPARPTVGLRGTGTFEFSFEQDALLKELGGNLKTVAWLFLLIAIALVARFGMPLLQAIGTQSWSAAAEAGSAIIGALALLWIFWSLRESGGLFQEIVESESQDLPLLIQALRSLNRAFGTVALVIAGIGLVGLVLTVFTAGVSLGTPSPAPAPKAPPSAVPAAPAALGGAPAARS